MTRRALASDCSRDNIQKLSRRVIDHFEVELLSHFEIEEQVLFPACGPLPIIGDLVAEHRALEATVAETRTAPSGELLEQFCELLSSHIRREERELFEQIQQSLPRELLDQLGGEIDRRVVRACLGL
jgi:iron-sulfur cluster repair protein YtfE (RIC family)